MDDGRLSSSGWSVGGSVDSSSSMSMACRYLGVVALGLLAWLVPCAPVQAQSYSCMTSAQWSQSSVPAHCTQGLAFSQCMAATEAAVQRLKQQHPSRADEVEGLGCPMNSSTSFRCYARIPGITETVCNETGGPWAFFKSGTECENGVSANTPDGCAPSPEDCLARNSDSFGGMKLGPSGGYCAGGCMYKPTAPFVSVGGSTSAVFEFSGEVCGATDPDLGVDLPKEAGEDQECKPVAGQTFCLARNGDHCYSASTGRQVCWKPGETGQKNDGPVRQKRDAGDTAIPPNLSLPNGDTLEQSGNPVTTTTNTSTTTITTTTTNYTTINGTDANGGDGSGNDGQNSDGSGGNDGGEGDEDGDGTGKESADCEVLPQCSNGDAIGCAMLRQQWISVCGLKDAIGEDPAMAGNHSLDTIPGYAGAESEFTDFDSLSFDSIDLDGWAGRGSCPIVINFTVFGRTFNTDNPQLCELLDALATLVNLIAAIHAAMIIYSGSRR